MSAAGGRARRAASRARGAGSSRRSAGAASRRAGLGRAGPSTPSYAPPGCPATIGPWASSSWSTSTASCTAAATPSRAWPRSLPIARPVATTSCTSPTTRCTTGPTTRRGSPAMGAPVTPDTVVSSARATAAYLREHDPGIRRVLVLGGSGLERELRDVGLRRGHLGQCRHPDEPGGDRRIRRRRRAGRGRGRARPEPHLPPPGRRQRLHPGGRPFHRHQPRPGLSRPNAACGRVPARWSSPWRRPPASCPVSIGKPAPFLLEAAAHAVGREPGEAIMIGDGIETDLAAARAVGARCVFMLTGVTTRAAARGPPARPAADRGGRRRRRAGRDPRDAGDGLTGRGGSQLRPPDGPGGELGTQRREVDLVGEGDVERVAVDRPQLGDGQPDDLDGPAVLLGQA